VNGQGFVRRLFIEKYFFNWQFEQSRRLECKRQTRIAFFRYNRVDGLARDAEFVGQIGLRPFFRCAGSTLTGSELRSRQKCTAKSACFFFRRISMLKIMKTVLRTTGLGLLLIIVGSAIILSGSEFYERLD
jgi:hypothetical protein